MRRRSRGSISTSTALALCAAYAVVGFLAENVAVAVPQDGFQRVQRPGSVNIDQEYDLTGLTIPKDQIHTLLPRDAIPALTNPKTQPASTADWLPDDARIIRVTVGDSVLGVPLRVLDWHEVVNATVGGEPIAATYCPLCDSATVFRRTVSLPRKPGEANPAEPARITLEFGVSGALYNSNVLMYDRRDKGLWSQLGMQAVSGPLAGTSLDMLPVELISFKEFKQAHPDAPVVSRETGYQRDYTRSPYESYFRNENLLVPVAGVGEALPRKTLGVGIAVGDGASAWAWFVPADAIGDVRTITTPLGDVVLKRTPAGVAVVKAPPDVRTAQTFYYSWSAFFPQTRVVRAGDPPGSEKVQTPGLVVGDRAPSVMVTALDGTPVSLASLYERGPIVLTFYRGGWCPICNRALQAWAGRLSDLKAVGGTFVALTPEKPDLAAQTREKSGGDYLVFSDGDFAAAKAFKVHFVVDAETRARYEQYGLKVGEANVSGTWELPAPATFVIDREGVIRYVFADWDYRRRANPEEVLDAVRRLTRP